LRRETEDAAEDERNREEPEEETERDPAGQDARGKPPVALDELERGVDRRMPAARRAETGRNLFRSGPRGLEAALPAFGFGCGGPRGRIGSRAGTCFFLL
jgi:hypothetical protein